MGIIKDEEQLRKLYEYPKGRAAIKVINELEQHSKEFLKLSPFVVISSMALMVLLMLHLEETEKGLLK